VSAPIRSSLDFKLDIGCTDGGPDILKEVFERQLQVVSVQSFFVACLTACITFAFPGSALGPHLALRWNATLVILITKLSPV